MLLGGVASCLAFIDFFSVAAQRSALSVTANCCLSLTPAEFHRISDHLAPLARRLAHEDQKVAEAACLVFCRLAETFKTDPLKVQAIADSGALINVQQLLVASPAVIGSSTFCEVARMLRMLCSHCPDIAVRLLSENMAETLRTLLSGDTEQMAQQSRNSEEVYALVCLLAEMLPALPAAGLFDVDQWLSRVPPRPTSSHDRDSVVWQWQDDEGSWHNFSEADSAAIQAAARSDGSRDPSRPELANLPSRSRAVRRADPADGLKEIIEMQEMSVHLAGLLSSTDVKMVVAGVQLSETLMQKLPDLCRVHYKREGVVHHMTCLAAGDDPLEGVGSRTARPAQVGETSTDMSLRDVLKRRRSSRRGSLAAQRNSRERLHLPETPTQGQMPTRQEQLSVKTYDVTGGLSGRCALRYFNEHQLKCNLQRVTDGGSLRQWRHGPVKVDPLAPVEAIERYLVIRGYGRPQPGRWSDDSDSDDDVDDALVRPTPAGGGVTFATAASLGLGGVHRLQFLIGGRPLPYDMTVFQAVEQFGQHATQAGPEQTTLQLLRLLHALSRHYGTLYHMEHCPPLLSEQEFINSQLTAKASRQLRDPLILMTGSTPQWIQQIGLTW
ncbi:E3 ubiquitin-protein ligase TRIP12-like [Pollicipes pollicipes]|uniref:E3 ubiquitin-protein ligase TRIP12-like n=1 Tax=Pollicipes pollicipes TaxID=41117 RepID=UPI0018853A07|nr:E3 ubiquitin-protein ligase TRIP12-like [Pollicipes pollicipes]